MKYLAFLFLLSLQLNLFSQAQYQHWQWARSFGGPGNDSTVDMKIKNGFLYVTGTFSSPQINWEGTQLINTGGRDIFVAKLDTAGNTIWVKSFGSTGDENVLQLEINSSGAMVLRCQSTSPTVSVGSATLNTPANFYTVFDINGNVLNAVTLPSGAVYRDIDIDLEKGVYISAAYLQPFYFNGALIDSSYGLAGAAILKYNNLGNAAWYKNVQVRSNRRYESYNYDDIDPYVPGPPIITCTPAITGNARASMQIEFNELDSVIGVICSFNYIGYFGSIAMDHYNDAPQLLQLKIAADGGVAARGNFCSGYASFSGSWADDFKTGASGCSYTTSGYGNLGGFHAFLLTKEKNNDFLSNKYWGYYSNSYGVPDSPAPAWSPLVPDETGNYLLCAEVRFPDWPGRAVNNNAVILDSNLNEFKKTHVAEINRLPLSIKCMADTNALFFASTFSGETLTINEHLPGAELVLQHAGMSEIFIGKYLATGIGMPALDYPYKTSYKTCKPADTIQLYLGVTENNSAGPYTYHWEASTHLSDTTVLNPKVFIGTDSIINRLTITDANGIRFTKDFVFFSGVPSNLSLNVSNINVCNNDTVTLSLSGTDFEPCLVLDDPGQYGALYYDRYFTSSDKTIKYVPSYTHTLRLVSDYEKNYYSPSPYCINSEPVQVVVRTAFSQAKDVYLCPGADYTFDDSITVHNIQQPFSHTIHFTNTAGCDSNYITNIVVAPVYSKTKNYIVCPGYDFNFPDNIVFHNVTTDTTHTCHFTSVYGCDSIIIFNLRINPVSHTIQNIPICSGSNYSYRYYNFYDTLFNITSDTSFVLHWYSYRGCDSFVTMNIVVVPYYNNIQNIATCKGSNYIFPDGSTLNNITVNSSHTSRLISVYGCDSIITTNITVYPTYNSTRDIAICSGSSYTFPDGSIENNISSAVSHTSRLTSADGCDSIITTNISVHPIYNSTRDIAICSGSSYTFPDGSTANSISSNINHASRLATVNGCDSIINTNITVITIDTSVTKNILELTANSNGSVYQWLDCTTGTSLPSANNQAYTASSIGSYAVSVTMQGCTDTSSCYIITAADLLAGGRALVNVYPVPAHDRFVVIIQSEKPATLDLSILDFTGTIVKTARINLLFGKNMIGQNISSLVAGRYTLVMKKTDGNEVISKTIIKL